MQTLRFLTSFKLPVVFIAALLAGRMTSLAQVAPVLDSFNPNANNIIRVVTVQPDGKVLIGGIFTQVAPNGGPSVTRNRIARFNADGTLDTAFNPNANSDVYAIAVQPDGKIVVGGYFTIIGGITNTNINRIARLDGVTGAADLSFTPQANEVVRTIVLEPSGSMLVGGDFGNIGATIRKRIARLSTNGLVDSNFNPDAGDFSSVYSIVPDSLGRLLVVGTFTSIGGQLRNRAARLTPSTGAADSWNPDVDSDVLTVAEQADGKILLGGFFSSVGGETRFNIARVDATNGVPDSFDPVANTTVQVIAVQADGRIIAGGGFTAIGGDARGRLAWLDPDTGLALYSNPNVGGFISSIKLQPDGAVLVAGSFDTISAQPRGRVARFSFPPKPTLTIGRAANESVVLSWPTNSTGYTLEASTNLVGGIWNSVSPAPVIADTNNVVTNNVSEPSLFYRLRQ